MDYNEVTLTSINSGAVVELFDAAFKRVLENIADPSTSAKTVREVTIKVKVKPSNERDNATTTVSVVEKLAPITPHESFMLLSSDGDTVSAFVADPKQQSLPLEEQGNVTPFASLGVR